MIKNIRDISIIIFLLIFSTLLILSFLSITDFFNTTKEDINKLVKNLDGVSAYFEKQNKIYDLYYESAIYLGAKFLENEEIEEKEELKEMSEETIDNIKNQSKRIGFLLELYEKYLKDIGNAYY